MNLWWWIYALAGAGAIGALVLGIVVDLDRLVGWVRGLEERPPAEFGIRRYDHIVDPPPVRSSPGLYALVLGILVGLWITAAVLR